MAVAYETKSNGTQDGGSSTTITIPSGTASGDLLLMFCCHWYGSNDPSAPSGWTELHDAFYNQRHTILYKIAGSSESSFTYTYAVAASYFGWAVLRFSGVDGTTPIDVSSMGAGSYATTHDAPAITTTASDCMIVRGFLGNPGFATPPSGYTERHDIDYGLYIATRDTNPASGLLAAVTFTHDIWNCQGFSVALKPASGGGGGGSFAPYLQQPQTWQFVGRK
jgi:hypothetical protein